ncbi:MAG: toxin-activating lysine-acyltransferase [Pseudomonadota bacterium]
MAPQAATPSPSPKLHLAREKTPAAGIGHAAVYLMSDPVFSRLRFGQLTRLLTGQANRGHYLFVMDGPRIVGFAGWALTSHDIAERWLANDLAHDIDGTDGPACTINIWKADTGPVNTAIVRGLRMSLPKQTTLYARRFYPDGTIRPVRLPVARIVSRTHAGAKT